MSHFYQKKRVFHDDGTWSDVSTVKFAGDSLRFKNIVLRDYQIRINDIAHLRYAKAISRGEVNPVVVVWACLEEDRLSSDLFSTINTMNDEGEHLMSANSLVNYTMRTILNRQWLYYADLEWQLNIPHEEVIWQERSSTIVNWLIKTDRLHLRTSPNYHITKQDFDNFDVLRNAIPVGRCGFLRREVQENRYQIAFNSSYFLLEHDDFLSHHSSLGEAYNLQVSAGEIIRPPLYLRSAIYQDSTFKWHLDRIGMQDIDLHLPDDLILSHGDHSQDAIYSFSVNPETPSPIAIYTRYFGVESEGVVHGYTPLSDNRIELTIIDRDIVGWKSGGELLIPQNGFVLSFAANQLSEQQLNNILDSPKVTYTFSGKFSDIKEAIQCGPHLLNENKIVLTDNIFDEESFWISRTINQGHVIGVVPTDYPIDIDTTRAGRVGLGITATGELLVVAISGVNAGYDFENTDSMGATLVELACYLQEAGAVNAINLDGGGSSQLFYQGGALTRFGDRRGLVGVIYERMIPSIGFIS